MKIFSYFGIAFVAFIAGSVMGRLAFAASGDAPSASIIQIVATVAVGYLIFRTLNRYTMTKE